MVGTVWMGWMILALLVLSLGLFVRGALSSARTPGLERALALPSLLRALGFVGLTIALCKATGLIIRFTKVQGVTRGEYTSEQFWVPVSQGFVQVLFAFLQGGVAFTAAALLTALIRYRSAARTP